MKNKQALSDFSPIFFKNMSENNTENITLIGRGNIDLHLK